MSKRLCSLIFSLLICNVLSAEVIDTPSGTTDEQIPPYTLEHSLSIGMGATFGYSNIKHGTKSQPNVQGGGGQDLYSTTGIFEITYKPFFNFTNSKFTFAPVVGYAIGFDTHTKLRGRPYSRLTIVAHNGGYSDFELGIVAGANFDIFRFYTGFSYIAHVYYYRQITDGNDNPITLDKSVTDGFTNGMGLQFGLNAKLDAKNAIGINLALRQFFPKLDLQKTIKVTSKLTINYIYNF